MFKRIISYGVSLGILALALPSLSHALTLKEAITSAKTYNAKLRSATYELSNNKAMAYESLTSWLPTVTYVRNNTMYKKVGDYTYSTSNPDQRPNDQTISISENLFNGGQDVVKALSAKAGYNASVMQYNATKEQVFFDTIQSYMDLKRDIESLNVAESTQKTLSQHYKVTQVRYNAGAATKTDLAQAHSRWASAQASFFASKANVDKSKAKFFKITGIENPDNLEYPVLPDIPSDFNAVLNTARQYNRGLKIQEATKKTAEYKIMESGGSFLPMVNLEYMWHKALSDGGGFGSLTGVDPITGSVHNNVTHEGTLQDIKLNFTWVLFAKGTRFFGLKTAFATNSKMASDLLDTQRSLTESISEAWSNYKSAETQIDAYNEAVKAQSESLKGVQQQSNSGTRTLTDVLDSEQELYTAKQHLVVAKHGETVAAYLLLLEMGILNENTVK